MVSCGHKTPTCTGRSFEDQTTYLHACGYSMAIHQWKIPLPELIDAFDRFDNSRERERLKTQIVVGSSTIRELGWHKYSFC